MKKSWQSIIIIRSRRATPMNKFSHPSSPHNHVINNVERHSRVTQWPARAQTLPLKPSQAKPSQAERSAAQSVHIVQIRGGFSLSTHPQPNPFSAYSTCCTHTHCIQTPYRNVPYILSCPTCKVSHILRAHKSLLKYWSLQNSITLTVCVPKWEHKRLAPKGETRSKLSRSLPKIPPPPP